MITQSFIKERFNYKDGQLIWKVKPSINTNIGDIAGSKHPSGYINIFSLGKGNRAHRLIWMYHNGDIPDGLQIDHINGTRDDNHIENLRLVTQNENQWNRKTAKGYSWHKSHKKWHSQIKVNGKVLHLGYFDNEEEARQVYLDAKEKYHVIAKGKGFQMGSQMMFPTPEPKCVCNCKVN
jgi:hypothetical protein